jgi:hypothetical protein
MQKFTAVGMPIANSKVLVGNEGDSKGCLE